MTNYKNNKLSLINYYVFIILLIIIIIIIHTYLHHHHHHHHHHSYVFSKYLSQIRNITSKIAKNQTHYPHTFIILPKLAPEKLTSDVPVMSKVANFVNRKVLHQFYLFYGINQSYYLYVVCY